VLTTLTTIGSLLSTTPALAKEVVDLRPKTGFERIRYDLGGFVQPRFNYEPEDPQAGTDGVVGFQLRRVRLELKGKYEMAGDVSLQHKMSFEWMSSPRLVDTYLDIGKGKTLRFRVGQYKTPTSRSVLVSDRRTMFPDRAEILDMTPQRDIGAMLHGAIGDNHVEWAAGVFNGEGTNLSENENRKMLYAWRTVFSPIGGPGTRSELMSVDQRTTFSIGYTGFLNRLGEEKDEVTIANHGVEAFAHWRPLTVQSEWHWGERTTTTSPPSDSTFGGGYVQAGLFTPLVPWAQEHIAVVGKYETVETFNLIGGNVPLEGYDDEAQAREMIWTGVGYYAGSPLFNSIHSLRIQVLYGKKTELEGMSYDNDRVMVAGHMNF